MQGTKKIPMRKCMGCNESIPKKELIRIVRTPTGEIVLDKTSKLNGRGAYICENINCLKKVRKSKRIDRVLNITISEAVYDELELRLLNDR